MVSGASLDALLFSCNGLRNFYLESINIYRRVYMRDHYRLFKLSHAVAFLSRYRTTLQSLHRDLRRWDNARGTGSHIPPLSFRDFTALEHMFLNTNELYNEWWAPSTEDSSILVQLLPPTIVSLHLAGPFGKAHPRLEKGLQTLADAVSKAQFPRLK